MVVQSGRTSVSAVIPAYNAEQFISDPIQSILAQSYEISEIIVVDDGSADHTAEVAAGFPRTRVIRGPNCGQAAARNTGVYAASGEWIAFLDHDDLWLPRKTEIQLQYATPDAGALVRKQALLDAGGFEESRAVQGVEDLTLWLKIALTDWRFVSSEIGLYQWRETGQNQSANHLKMARADLASIQMAGNRVSCQPQEIERVKEASRIEYAKNLIAGEQWDEAAQLLEECTPGLASRWLSLARLLKVNRLARTNLIKWLHTIDGGYVKHVCSGECSLPEFQRAQCMESCHKPYFRSLEVG